MRKPHVEAVALGEVLHPNSNWVLLDPANEYKQVTVKLWGKGVVQRAVVKGSDIATSSQLLIRAGQFIVSRIDARHGAFGLVPSELDGAVVSGDFPCFDVDEARVSARYLAWVSRTSAFVALARAGSEGSTNRVRLKEERFLRQTLLLPPLVEQDRIAARLDSVAERIAKRAAAVKRVDVELEATLQVMFHRLIAGARITRLNEVAPLVRRAVTVDAEQTYTEIGIRSFFRGTFQRRTVLGAEFTWQNLFMVQTEDLVFSNIMAWEGAVAVARAKDKGCVGNHRMLTCEVDPLGAVPVFLLFYFQQPAGFAQIVAASPSSIARNRTLGPAALADLRVPLPSLDAQKDFATLHAKVQAIRAAQRDAGEELDKLLPALLDETFVEGPAVSRAAA